MCGTSPTLTIRSAGAPANPGSRSAPSRRAPPPSTTPTLPRWASGHPYVAEGHVLFSVGSYPRYGHLSGRSPDELLAGARIDVAPYKRDPSDFVLWKPSTPDL